MNTRLTFSPLLPYFTALLAVAVLGGCAGYQTFPATARSGDTVSFMIGGTEEARTSTVEAVLTDSDGTEWDLQSLNLVRSVFNMRSSGVAQGLHYSPYLDTFVSWSEGHEPVQTVLVTDLPDGLPTGEATIAVTRNVTDDSSGVSDPVEIKLEIVPGQGQPDPFTYRTGFGTEQLDFNDLEPAPYAKLAFGNIGDQIGALHLEIDFDESVVDPNDLNVYSPQSTVRGDAQNEGTHGEKQRMVYWRQDGDRLYIDAVAPQGLEGRFLMFYVVHPDDVQTNPQFALVSSAVYDVDGNPLSLSPSLEYRQ